MASIEGAQGGVIQVRTGNAAYAKGDFWAKGSVAGYCLDDIAANSTGAVQLHGVFHDVPFGGQTAGVAVGDKLYCSDNQNTVNKSTGGGRVAVGYALSSKANSNSGTVDLLLALGVG